MKNIIIAGGSGLIGKSISSFLAKEGDEVSWLSRRSTIKNNKTYYWNPEKSELDIASLKNADVLIQLAGTSLADGRWTKKRKQDIINSRINSIRTIYKHLKLNQLRIPHIIQASAIGFYGDRGSEVLNENSISNHLGFLSDVCSIWESEAHTLKEFTDCLTIIRTGLYLNPEGGIWSKILQTIPLGFLVSFGNGKQFYSWIHHHDYNRAISFVIKNKIGGVINLTAPNPVANKEFIDAINNHLKRKVLQFKVPEFALKIIFGELSEPLISSDYVMPQVLLNHGFTFKFEKLDDAIVDLLYPKSSE